MHRAFWILGAAALAKLRLGRDLPAADVADIVSLLESLTGEVSANFAQAPILPVTHPSR